MRLCSFLSAVINPFKLRWPNSIEILFQVIISIFLAAIIFDFVSAYYSFDCRDSHRPRGGDCYPWGMTEGPLEGGSWNYMNKDIYLKSSVLFVASLLTLIVAPFLTRSPWHTLGIVLLTYLFARYAAEGVAGFL